MGQELHFLIAITTCSHNVRKLLKPPEIYYSNRNQRRFRGSIRWISRSSYFLQCVYLVVSFEHVRILAYMGIWSMRKYPPKLTSSFIISVKYFVHLFHVSVSWKFASCLLLSTEFASVVYTKATFNRLLKQSTTLNTIYSVYRRFRFGWVCWVHTKIDGALNVQ